MRYVQLLAVSAAVSTATLEDDNMGHTLLIEATTFLSSTAMCSISCDVIMLLSFLV